MPEDTPSAPQPETSAKPAAPVRKTGLSPKQQKLQAMLEKAHGKGGNASTTAAATGGFKAKNSFAGKKTSFQRKAT